MSYWAIIFLVLIVAMVVGPIVMLKPSQRDRKLAGLREAAAEKGIRVRLLSLQQSSGKQLLAVYSLPLPKEHNRVAAWSLIKQPYEHGGHFYGQWDWVSQQQRAPDHQHQAIINQLQQIDNSIVGFEYTNASVGVYWLEKSINIDEVEKCLLALKGLFIHSLT